MNSGNGAFGRPVLPGYTVAWDDEIGEWVATSDSEARFVLRGKNQAELDRARHRLVVQLADELREILRAAPAHGYSPPPPRT